MCGEQHSAVVIRDSKIGSPPRVRGTVFLSMLIFGLPRITPACAGNRVKRVYLFVCDRDHPRVCGEQFIFVLLWLIIVGSPPRVRGTDGRGRGDGYEERITPACAGNRYRMNMFLISKRDHPRVCGEQGVSSTRMVISRGSPPRVRGTVENLCAIQCTERITPACAGNRLKKARHFYILFCQIKRIHLV